MVDVIEAVGRALACSGSVERMEAGMLQHQQAPCPVAHHFGPGVYMREVTIPAGCIAIGHAQRMPHLNIMLQGRVVIFGDDGSTRELVAPLTFTGQPGRKVGYVLEDVVWLNVYATEEHDIDKLEATYLDKSPAFEQSEAMRRADEHMQREADRADYWRMLDEIGVPHDLVRAQSEHTGDQIPMPDGWQVRVQPSPIEGLGLFTSLPVDAGQTIAPARIDGMRTPAGRYTNHSATPNAQMMLRFGGDIDLVALRHIDGCHGGGQGEEVTIDYRQAVSLAVKHIKEQA